MLPCHGSPAMTRSTRSARRIGSDTSAPICTWFRPVRASPASLAGHRRPESVCSCQTTPGTSLAKPSGHERPCTYRPGQLDRGRCERGGRRRRAAFGAAPARARRRSPRRCSASAPNARPGNNDPSVDVSGRPGVAAVDQPQQAARASSRGCPTATTKRGRPSASRRSRCSTTAVDEAVNEGVRARDMNGDLGYAHYQLGSVQMRHSHLDERRASRSTAPRSSCPSSPTPTTTRAWRTSAPAVQPDGRALPDLLEARPRRTRTKTGATRAQLLQRSEAATRTDMRWRRVSRRAPSQNAAGPRADARVVPAASLHLSAGTVPHFGTVRRP